jgi:hypothetical protein
VRRAVDVLVIPGKSPSGCAFDGMLGMDVLAGCVITLDEKGAFARCSEK